MDLVVAIQSAVIYMQITAATALPGNELIGDIVEVVADAAGD
jgi:hypothetical protein